MGIEKAFFAFVFGTVFGSFFNVVIYRVPNAISIVKPSSHCPVCNKTLKWYHNIPLISYVFLGGKCAYCGAKIPFSYFLVELFTGIVFSFLFLKDGFTILYFSNLFVFSILLIQAVIDFKYMEVPAVLNDLLLVGGLFYLVKNYSLNSVIFSIFVSVAFLILYFFYRKKLGFGDVKIFIALSMFFGYDLIYVILISSLLGIFFALLQSLIKKAKFSSIKLPFIPYILFGVIAYWIILYITRTSTLMNLSI
jgi:leader peptidase (prepilin peptidase)/N-methyltransferase